MSLPTTIGRYHVVGHLASGGMAEIVLAKVFGPAGFEQAVVLKRILPHLARQESFASMFVDEALIIARIRHPNVVRVHELGKEGHELFLVMEYLEGESLHGLMRRLASRNERLDYALCAHIVADACAGLHAAHEMRDDDGNPQNLVHRDVSPQNVFVTYGGEVKVLDFGVAMAADRITRTEAGQVKGKYAYMSPEQVNGEPLDRRSDLFALGTVLYELTTERRLFQRATELLTMQAVTDRPIRKPSEVVDGYPEPLEAVVMRALERDPSARYQTAQDMRLALLAAQRELGEVLAPDQELAARMQGLFADRIAEKRELLRRLRSGSDVTHVPEAEVDLEVELPSVVHEREEPTAVEVPPRRPRARRWPVLAAGAIVLAGAAGGLGAWLASGSDEAPPRSVAREERAPERETEPPPAPAPQRGAPVRVEVETQPRGAVVFADGDRIGPAPVKLEVPDGASVVLEGRHAGYRPASERIVAYDGAEVVLRLRRRRAAAPPAEEPDEETTEIERFP